MILTIARNEAQKNKRSFLKVISSVSFIQSMVIMSILFLILFLAFSMSKYVNEISGGILNSSGLPLLINQLFYISAAGLGATFAALFNANQYIINGTFDPNYLDNVKLESLFINNLYPYRWILYSSF